MNTGYKISDEITWPEAPQGGLPNCRCMEIADFAQSAPVDLSEIERAWNELKVITPAKRLSRWQRFRVLVREFVRAVAG